MSSTNKAPVNIFKRCSKEYFLHAIYVIIQETEIFSSLLMSNEDEQNVRGMKYEKLKLLLYPIAIHFKKNKP